MFGTRCSLHIWITIHTYRHFTSVRDERETNWRNIEIYLEISDSCIISCTLYFTLFTSQELVGWELAAHRHWELQFRANQWDVMLSNLVKYQGRGRSSSRASLAPTTSRWSQCFPPGGPCTAASWWACRTSPRGSPGWAGDCLACRGRSRPRRGQPRPDWATRAPLRQTRCPGRSQGRRRASHQLCFGWSHLANTISGVLQASEVSTHQHILHRCHYCSWSSWGRVACCRWPPRPTPRPRRPGSQRSSCRCYLSPRRGGEAALPPQDRSCTGQRRG